MFACDGPGFGVGGLLDGPPAGRALADLDVAAVGGHVDLGSGAIGLGIICNNELIVHIFNIKSF